MSKKKLSVPLTLLLLSIACGNESKTEDNFPSVAGGSGNIPNNGGAAGYGATTPNTDNSGSSTSGNNINGFDIVGNSSDGTEDTNGSGVSENGNSESHPDSGIDNGGTACGDGTIDPGEDCEIGLALTDTCQALGYESGELACDSTCHFDVNSCMDVSSDGGDNNGNYGTGGTGGNSGIGSTGSNGTFQPVTDLVAPGPFASTTINNSGPNGRYTIYLPEGLVPENVRNPIVGWMSGGSTSPAMYTLLPHLASHGFVIIASNTIPSIGAEVALGQEIIAGIDWILAENAKPESLFFDRLDISNIASMGYSMGGLATSTIAADPRLTTTVHISGGNFDPERAKNIHAPAAFFCGENDVANPQCATDFETATAPIFYGVFLGGDHLGVLFPPYADRIRGAVTGWLRWQLMDDQTLKTMFVGADCGLCNDPNWSVKQKNIE